MSALAGILFNDERTVPATSIRALAEGNAQRGPDGCGEEIKPGFAALHWSLHVDHLARRERQPYVSRTGELLTWDGRLDNRNDLLMQLRDMLRGDETDVAVVAAALEKWGYEAFARLIGDWSLAIWQADRKAVVLARDLLGNRPLHYTVRGDCAAYSTCLEGLVSLFDLYDRLDRRYLAGFLFFGTPPYLTPYQGVLPVPAGHFVRLRAGESPQLTRFRSLGINTIRYRRLDDYEAHLRSVFEDAVRVRMRADTPVWSELSGGLDSSAVTGMAASLVRRRNVETSEVRPTSRVYTGSRESDESSYIEAVEKFWDIASTRIRSDVGYGFETFVDTLRPYNRELLYQPLLAATAASRSRVLMTGMMGDLIMAKDGSHCASLIEYLQRGNAVAFVRGCAMWAWRTRSPLYKVVGQALSAYLPLSVRRRRSRRRLIASFAEAHRSRTNKIEDVLAVTPVAVELAAQTFVDPPEAITHMPPAKRLCALGVWQWSANETLATPDRLPELLITHPYAHLPLIEFVLAIPETLRWQPEKTRALMRNALGSLLPDLVRTRESKGYAPPAVIRSMRPLALALLESPSEPWLVQLGLVQQQGLNRLLRRTIDGSLANPAHVEKLIQMEAWLRRRRRTRPAISEAMTTAAVDASKLYVGTPI